MTEWDKAKFSWDQKTLIAVGDKREQRIKELEQENKQKEEYIVDLLDYITCNEQKLEAIRILNEALYEALPTGTIDAFELIKLIGSHYEAVAEVLG